MGVPMGCVLIALTDEGTPTLSVGRTFISPVSVEADSFTDTSIGIFRLPKPTEDQQFSRNLPGLWCQVGIAKTAGLVDCATAELSDSPGVRQTFAGLLN